MQKNIEPLIKDNGRKKSIIFLEERVKKFFNEK